MFKKINTKDLTQIAISTTLLAIASLVIIPIGFVPITLQVVLFLLIPAILGPVKGIMAIGIYMLAGLLGFPVFAGGAGGIGQLLSPSFGYILGAIPVGLFIGKGINKMTTKIQNGLIMLVGVFILYVIGIAYQYGLLNIVLDTPVKLGAILTTNLTVFLPIDTLKVLVSVLIYERLKKLSFYKRINRY
ncbi:MAG: biotin transporter BioY [Alkalibacterium sp.]|uniref:Biotin transporter n=1 Tax=Alkalibacterium gilvum TaxID=1130080 RepID=A0A1H6RZZ8_9LACT|nr:MULTISPECIES: biotin transporter BioY [Alkalibacterium]MDN6193974.1 biotin transporter BioY [Alkalibacterium sp.]MDN6293595.1 biotin transporter BioY [Alkalibacterium sp.]MDN6295306.1 biotin transporter BioY [Alkalibacterium sp.]MDN6326777.1 biotin transporter BioY [Alkalibacterium sp.]MDN6397573.1 biotin transporter BioY [Alkalibacterium sp.]